MSSADSEKQSHRTWIEQARLQTDEADRHAADARSEGRALGTPILRTDLLPGYSLEHEIHRGGQGTVYRAVQESTGRKVALKLLHNSAFGGPLERARFERETRVLAALHHPNIVAIHDGGSHDGRFYLVMDYIAGQPLDVYVASEPRSIRELLGLFIQICDAVNAAHIGGIIHRDLKPANVRVDSGGRPVVLDFGLAKFTVHAHDGACSDMTLTGQFIGSLPWAAPEQADGSPGRIDTRTDVYALGVLLFQMLTGKFPYPVVGNVKSVLDNILKADPIPPRTLNRQVDDELQTIVLKCLSKERDRRYQSAGELAADVRRYLQGEPIEAKRDSALYVLRKTIQRYRLPLVVAACFVLLLIGSSIVAWTLSVQARDAAEVARRAGDAAQKSDEAARLRLRDSLIAQARAFRRTGQLGQRFEALDALQKAAAIGPTLEARNEAIATMVLPDLREIGHSRHSGTGYFDPELKRCAVVDEQNDVTIVFTQDDSLICRIPPPACGVKEFHYASLQSRFFIRLFDPPTGQRHLEVWTVPDAKLHFELTDVPFQARHDISLDGTRLAVGKIDNAIHIYDLETARELQHFPVDRVPSYMTFDPSGRRLVLYHGAHANPQILDLQSGQYQPAFNDSAIRWSVAWHPEGQVLAGANNNQVVLWDAELQKPCGVLIGHEVQVVHIRYSPDGKLILTSSWDGNAILWDARSQRQLLRLRMAFPSFSNDGSRIAATMSSRYPMQAAVFELNTAPECRRLIGGGNPGSQLHIHARSAFDPQSDLLFVANSGDDGIRGLRIFDSANGNEVAWDHAESLASVVLDAKGDSLATAGPKGALHWPIRRIDNTMTIGPPSSLLDDTYVDPVELSSDGRRAVLSGYAEGEFTIIELNPRKEVKRVSCSIWGNARIRLSPDGRLGAWGGYRGSTSEVWDLDKQTRVHVLPPSFFAAVTFSPDGRLLAHTDGTDLVLWDTENWTVTRRIPGRFYETCFSGDGRVLSAGGVQSSLVHLIDVDTGEELARLEPPDGFAILNHQLNGDGTLLAQISNRAGVVYVWDLRRIREKLATMGLDWNSPPFMEAAKSVRPAISVSINGGQR